MGYGIFVNFYAVRQVLLRAYISYGNSVRLSVCLSRPGTHSRPGEIETPDLHHILEPRVSSFLWGNLVPHLQIVILPLLAHLAWKRLQIDTDLLLIITSTADELSSGTNIDDLERPWTPKIGVLVNFRAAIHITFLITRWCHSALWRTRI